MAVENTPPLTARVGTVGALLKDAASEVPDQTLLWFEDDSYSYAEVDRRADALAGALRELGVGRGDRVVGVLPNSPGFLFAFFGASRIGAALVPLNAELRAREVAGLLAEAGPAIVVTDGAHAGLVAEAEAEARSGARVVDVDELNAAAADDPAAGAEETDVAVMLATSGTTGSPKLVMHTHRGLVLGAQGFPWWLGLDSSDRLLTPLPLFHLNALVYSTLGAVAARAGLVLLERFSASRFWDQTRAYEATQFNTVGAMLELLARRPGRADDAGNPVRLCYTALAPATRERHLALERRFGMRIMAGYGLSETPYGTIWPREGPQPYGSMGRLRQHPSLGEINAGRVVDDEGRDVPAGEPGELLLRNPALMSGYFRRPEETEAALSGGWLHTGDVVRRDDDGVFWFVGRKKEIIRRRGENIAPAEIEAAIQTYPGVGEAAVVAVPSELSEDDVKAFVVSEAGATVDAHELRSWLSGRLARFKVPRYVEIVVDLPRTPTGRVAKQELARDRNETEIDFG